MVQSRRGALATILLNGSGQRVEIESEFPPLSKIELVLRPENLTILTSAVSGSKPAISGKVASVAFQGSNVEYSIDFGGEAPLRVIGRPELEIARDTSVWIGLGETRGAVFKID